MRWALLAALLFEPIVIDEATYNSIVQSAHQNFRGTEYDMLTQMLNQLEQRALAAKQAQSTPPPTSPAPEHKP